MSRSSKLILSKNIKLDKEYKEVLNYSEQQMLELMTDNSHFINRNDTFSFLRPDVNVIATKFTYAECLQSNYIAFTNPDYANKWFFAFVDDVKYISDGNTEIYYTIDVMTTWFSKVTPKQCFVVREHTMDDTVGKNLLPEDLELGDYVYESISDSSDLTDVCPVVAMNYDPTLQTPDYSGLFHGNIYQSFGFYIVKGPLASSYNFADQINALSSLMKQLASDGKADSVLGLFMAPKNLVGWTVSDVWTSYGAACSVKKATFSNEGVISMTSLSLNKPTTLDTYTPKNGKMKTYPYCYFNVNNNAGNDITYKYEYFSNNAITFDVEGTISMGCNIKAIPNNYKNITKNYSESINLGKYPMCSYNSDTFINWLTSQCINIPLNFLTSGVSVLSGFKSGNFVQSGSGLVSIVDSISSIYQHSLSPVQTEGNTNSGDINVSEGKCTFSIEKLSINREYAKIIDEYFTRFGYKTNLTKIPNINGRTYFNYVQIADSEVIGYGEVPNKYMDEINRIFRTGVTIWHDHSKIGDYTVTNSIVTP